MRVTVVLARNMFIYASVGRWTNPSRVLPIWIWIWIWIWLALYTILYHTKYTVLLVFIYSINQPSSLSFCLSVKGL